MTRPPTVLLTGATGFIGQLYLAKYSASQQIIATYRHHPGPTSVSWLKLDLINEPDFVQARAALASQSIDAIIHLGGSSPNRAYQDGNFSATVAGTQSLLRLAVDLQVKKFIYISSLSVLVDYIGPYKKSKLSAEAAVLSSSLPFTILRPTFVLGPGATDFYRLVLALRHHHYFPLLAGGHNFIQPLSAPNLIDIIAHCLHDSDTNYQIYPLVGPDIVTQRQFLSRLATLLGVHPRFFTLPYPLAHSVYSLLEVFYPKLGLNRERLHLQLQSSQLDPSSLFSQFGITPDNLDTMLLRSLSG